MSEEPQMVSVFVARNIAEADLIRGLLDDNGIDSMIQDEQGVLALDGGVSGNRGLPIFVRAVDRENAAQVIEEARERGRLTADDEEEE